MSDSPQDVHKKALGRRGEKLAEEYLKAEGCKILHKNYRTPFGEADLIVEDKDEVAFVEVKTRTSDALWQAFGGGGERETAPLSAHRAVLLAGNGQGAQRALRRGGSMGGRKGGTL